MKSNANAARISAFSSEPAQRKAGRLEIISRFLQRSKSRSHQDLVESLNKDNLFIHELEEKDLLNFLALAASHIERHEFKGWLDLKFSMALKDHSFDQAKVILDFSKQKTRFAIDGFYGSLSSEILDFLERNQEQIVFEPFVQINWDHNIAGVEGFVRLIKLIEPDSFNQFVKHGHAETREFSTIGLLAQEGHFDEAFDSELVDILIGKYLVACLNETDAADTHKLFLDQFDPAKVLYLLATQASYSENRETVSALKKTHAWADSKPKA